ncbi:hypothetical protein [Jidongwangia harbinensis]|uniref:hypothetical protein n=1 Tax=Jidongwangia harbinensis TaxID=2878561 RepID=UPI001CD92453|nr:hypothetical protein [Jidongwangia harbinensis]MCA2214852.1 hypothetical protein [Jidongwangia harbinensis]
MLEAIPNAAAIWMILLLLVALVVAIMALPHNLVTSPPPAAKTVDPGYATELAAAADRAAAHAGRCRTAWQHALAEVDAAWAAYAEADAESRRVTAATAYPLMRRRRARTENADRERYLHRTAVAACRRREISIAQLNEALAHRGWDPRAHPTVQEAALRRAVRDHRLAGYRAATERERQAWETAERAAAELRTLRAEACAAPLRTTATMPPAGAGRRAEQWAAAEPVRAAAA